jgi:hypothetical protein
MADVIKSGRPGLYIGGIESCPTQTSPPASSPKSTGMLSPKSTGMLSGVWCKTLKVFLATILPFQQDPFEKIYSWVYMKPLGSGWHLELPCSRNYGGLAGDCHEPGEYSGSRNDKCGGTRTPAWQQPIESHSFSCYSVSIGQTVETVLCHRIKPINCT